MSFISVDYQPSLLFCFGHKMIFLVMLKKLPFFVGCQFCVVFFVVLNFCFFNWDMAKATHRAPSIFWIRLKTSELNIIPCSLGLTPEPLVVAALTFTIQLDCPPPLPEPLVLLQIFHINSSVFNPNRFGGGVITWKYCRKYLILLYYSITILFVISPLFLKLI